MSLWLAGTQLTSLVAGLQGSDQCTAHSGVVLENGNYSWKVKAANDVGESDYSRAKFFKVKASGSTDTAGGNGNGKGKGKK